MAGTENKGYENSFEGLFKGCKWTITPYFGYEGITKLEKIIIALGATPIITTPKEHDEAVALISHMPMLVSQALMLTAKDSRLAMEMASSGFRDMTRLALSNEEMANDMVTMNHRNIEHAILKLYKSIGDLTSGNYPETIREIKQLRAKMF